MSPIDEGPSDERRAVPCHYWRESLAGALERHGTRWSFADLLEVVAESDAGLADVAGWLSDELRLGRVKVAVADLAGVPPQQYEHAAVLRLHGDRLTR
jgi:hypothetical protein